MPQADPCRRVENLPLDDSGKQREAEILSVADRKLIPVAAGGGKEEVADFGKEEAAGVGREVAVGNMATAAAGKAVMLCFAG